MSFDEGSDQTMTTEPVLNGEELPAKKKRSGIFGIIAILSSLILIPLSLMYSFSGSSKTVAAVSSNLKIKVVLTTEQFLTSGAGNVCNGVGDFKNIKSSTLNIKQGSWNTKVGIGSGILNDQGSCVYEITVAPPSNFKGGSIKISIDFPFGSLPEDIYPVGSETPYNITTISVPLD